MKKILIALLALVAVFCTFAGCGDAAKDNNAGNNTDVTDTTGDENNTDNTDGTGNGENTGDDNNGGENNDTGDEDDKPTYTIVQPITDGGSYSGGNYE